MSECDRVAAVPRVSKAEVIEIVQNNSGDPQQCTACTRSEVDAKRLRRVKQWSSRVEGEDSQWEDA